MRFRTAAPGVLIGRLRLDNSALGSIIFAGAVVPIAAAGLALTVYTKDVRLGFYMAACLLGACGILRYYYHHIKAEIAHNALRASAPVVVPLRFPYRALVAANPDERSDEMRLEAVRPGASLTLQRVDADGRIAISSEEGSLGFLSERDASALSEIDVGHLFVQLQGVRRDGPKAFRLRVRIDTWHPNRFTGLQSATDVSEGSSERTNRARGSVD